MLVYCVFVDQKIRPILAHDPDDDLVQYVTVLEHVFQSEKDAYNFVEHFNDDPYHRLAGYFARFVSYNLE